MKGILFCEFIEFLEGKIGDDQAQSIIDDCKLKSEGAYARVGQYDYQELIQLLTQAATITNIDAGTLLHDFADHLFGVFKRDYGTFFETADNAADMLKQIDDHIHVEVKKLYPDAELPKFSFTEANKTLTLNYQSPRPLAGVAHALVSACIKHFDSQSTLTDYNIADDQKSAVFTIQV